MQGIINLLIVFVIIGMASCGDTTNNPYEKKPNTVREDDWTDVVKPVVEKNCVSCHEAFSSKESFGASRAKGMVESGKMPPPPKTISDEDKARIIGYFN